MAKKEIINQEVKPVIYQPMVVKYEHLSSGLKTAVMISFTLGLIYAGDLFTLLLKK